MLDVRQWIVFSIRDLFWLTVVIALAICLYQTSITLERESVERKEAVEKFRRAESDCERLQDNVMDKQQELSELRRQLERPQAKR